MGLKEVEKEKSLKRSYTKGSLLELIIRELKLKGVQEEEHFELAFSLSVIWINRLLFLKLLEARLKKINKDEGFLNTNNIKSTSALNSLFFHVLAKEKDQRDTSIFKNLPYLNSSLFELDDLEKKYIQINNIALDIPIKLHDRTVLEEKKKLNVLEYILSFLKTYNFSNEESDIFKSERLINSAVLGLVFEKLNGYKEGSFFTPSIITQYLVRTTLENSILKKINKELNPKAKSFQELLEYSKNFDLEQRKKFKKLVDTITIIDPSVGSGHFLVSSLNELLVLKSKLRLTEGIKIECENEELFIEKDIKLSYERNEDGTFSAQSEEMQRYIFNEKKNIIENQLFGIDINPNSVKITQLRLWIELLKESYYEEEKLTTLPNIDINIKTGNALVSHYPLYLDPTQNSSFNIDTKRYKEDVKLYKDTNEKSFKTTLEKNIQDFKKTLNKTLKDGDPVLSKFKKLLNSYIQDHGFKELEEEDILNHTNRHNLNFYARFGRGYEPQNLNIEDDELKEKRRVKELKELNKLKDEKNQIENDPEYKRSFEYKIEFPEVLDEIGKYQGFDIVVANPPYIRQEKIKHLKNILARDFKEVYTSTADIYVYFYLQAYKILKEDGDFAFITSNKFFRSEYGKYLRHFILNYTKLKELCDFNGFKVFKEAVVDTTTLVLEKSKKQSKDFLFHLPSKEKTTKYNLVFKNSTVLKTSSLKEEAFIFLKSKEEGLKKKIEQKGKVLKEWDININYGIKTGLNEAFIINEEKKNELIAKDIKSKELIKPILRGRDIKKYEAKFNGEYIINTYSTYKKDGEQIEGIDVEEYPAIKEHLKSFEPKLSKRTDQGDTAYHLRKCAYLEDFAKEKIVWGNINYSANFQLDNDKFINAPANLLTSETVSLKFLISQLNSKIFNWYFSQAVGITLGKAFEWKKQYVEKLPIPDISKEEQQPFIELVEQILKAKQQGEDTSKLEEEIDLLTYKLYNLNSQEIELVKWKRRWKMNDKKAKKAKKFFNKAVKEQEQGNNEKAIELYKKAIELNPNLSEAYNNMGNALNNLKNYEEAIKYCKKAIKLNPDDRYAYSNMGIALSGSKRYEEAIKSFKKAIKLNPDDRYAYSNMGIALSGSKRYEEAIKSFKKAIEINPNYSKAYYNMGSALYDLKKYEEAIESFEKAIEHNSNNSEAYYNMGVALYDLKKYEEAIKSYKKAIELNPNDSEAYYNMGNALSVLQRYEEAIESYKKAIEINPNFSEAYFNMGVALYNLKRNEEAIESYKKAIELTFTKSYEGFKTKSFYKFKAINENTLKMLNEKEVYFADVKNLNDPMDTPVRSYLNKNNALKEVLKKIKVFSLVKSDEEDFEKYIKNTLMFSHYANSHKGIVIEYELTKEFLEKNNLFYTEIEYKTEFKPDSIENFFNIKDENWSYENEVRLIKNGDDNTIKLNEGAKIKSIIFGLDCSEKDISLVKKICGGWCKI